MKLCCPMVLVVAVVCLPSLAPRELALAAEAPRAESVEELRARARAAYKAGDWAEALIAYEKLIWESQDEEDRREAVARLKEIDERHRSAPPKPAPPLPEAAPPVPQEPSKAQPPAPVEPASPLEDLRARARAAYSAGDWPGAFDAYQRLILDSGEDADLKEAATRLKEIDRKLKTPPSRTVPGTPEPAQPVRIQPLPPAPARPPEPSPRDPGGWSVSECLAIFRSGVEPDCSLAREALCRRGPSVLPALREADRGRLPTAGRIHLASLYGALGDSSSSERLIQWLADPSPEVRAEACRALGRLKSPGASEKILDLLKDGTTRVREAAAVALGRMGDAASVADLAAALADPKGQPGLVRAAAAEGLGWLNVPQSRGPLVMALRDADSRVRRAALDGLRRLTGGVHRCYDPDAPERDREAAVRSWEEWLAEQGAG